MDETLYKVMEGANRLADNMTLENAMMFIEAYFQKFYADPSIRLTIQRTDYSDEWGTSYEDDLEAKKNGK